MRRARLYIVLFLLSCVFNLFFSTATSPLFHSLSQDSDIFRAEGLALLRGYLPYIDLFDHKGFYLYLLNALGLWIHKEWGIIILQSVFLFFTLYVVLKTGKVLSVSAKYSNVIVVIFTLSCLFLFGYGNMTEDWSLFFVVLPIYFCLKSIKCSYSILSYSELFAIGACIGIVSMIRANNIIPVFGFVFFLLAENLKEKRYKYIQNGVLCAIAGCCCAILPAVLFFYFHGGLTALYEMFYGTILFNLDYAQHYRSSDSLFFFKSFSPGFVVLFCVLSLFSSASKRFVCPLVLSYIFMYVCVGSECYQHYFIVFIPLMCVSLFLLLKKGKTRQLIVICVCLILQLIVPLGGYIKHHLLEIDENIRLESDCHLLLSNVPAYDRNSIWAVNFGRATGLLVNENIVQCNRMILDFQLKMSEHLKQQECTAFARINPKWILIRHHLTESDINDLQKDSYQVVDSIPFENNSIYLYRKAIRSIE